MDLKRRLSKLMKVCLMLFAICSLCSVQAANLTLERRISQGLDTPGLSGKAVWLEADETRFLAIYSSSSAKTSLGGALILHDAGRHADWKEVIQPLRLHLSQQGWNTLSLQLPVTDSPPHQSTTLQLLEQASPRIQAAVDYLASQQLPTLVLVGHGLGAAMALHHVTIKPNQQFKAIAAIGLSVSMESKSGPVSQALAKLKIPLLDLFGSRDLTTVIESASRRRQIAFLNGLEGYRQEKVNGADHFFSGLQSSLSNRIHAWLKRTAASQTDN